MSYLNAGIPSKKTYTAKGAKEREGKTISPIFRCKSMALIFFANLRVLCGKKIRHGLLSYEFKLK
jgi:hypothetical protein